MSVDREAAERFVLANARLLERRRLDTLLHDAPTGPVLDALRAYRNADGGFGNALEPDVRSPRSEPIAALAALELLADLDALDDPMCSGAAAWLDGVAEPDGGIPFVTPSAAHHPRAPWMVPSDGGSHLTFGLAAVLVAGGSEGPWLERAVRWCWERLERPDDLGAYWVKFALAFLDAVPEAERARATIECLRPRLDPDGGMPVPGGTEDERLTPLALSPRPGLRSRALFGPEQIAADLDRVADGQREDGGWSFDWLAWSPGQEVETRGIVTVGALETLRAAGRL